MASSDDPAQPSGNPSTDASGPVAGQSAVVLGTSSAVNSPYIPQQIPILLQMPAQAVTQTITQQIWQGPFPPPNAVREYEAVLPGCFNRLITMAEEAQRANIQSNERAQEFTRRDIQRGHFLGWSLTGLAMVGSILCVYLQAPVVAAVFLAVPVMTVAKALIDSRRAVSVESKNEGIELPEAKQAD